MATDTIAARPEPAPHVCRFLSQSPDNTHAARCLQCGTAYRLALLHEMAHTCLLDLAGSVPGACQRCGSVFSATLAEGVE